MTNHDIFELIRVIVIIALVVFAAALATPKGRMPLALRGLQRILRKDRGLAAAPVETTPPSPLRRLLSFVLILIAIALALINV